MNLVAIQVTNTSSKRITLDLAGTNSYEYKVVMIRSTDYDTGNISATAILDAKLAPYICNLC